MTTKQEILKGLNQEQRDAVINYHGKTSLEAIPGSGKTHTLVARCQYMIKDGIKPSRILVFTFTKKAAQELKERITSAIGPDADKMTVCTYHSFCGKILRKFPEYTGRTRNFSIYDEDEKVALVKKIQKNFTQAPENVRTTLSYISNFKAQGLTPQEALRKESVSSFEKVSAMIYSVYAKELEKRNAFDFDDLPFFAYKLTSTNKEILDAITSKYDYILSDENQDANKQNMDFILLLGSRTNNIFVVGDTDQSIYGFRGADVDNVIKTYKKQEFNMKFLSTNYRSTQMIVGAADYVIKNNTSRVDKELKSNNENGNKIKYIKCLDQTQESSYIAQKIINMKKQNSNLKYSDFAVLTRLQSQTRLIESEMLKNHIPYKLKGMVPFFARTEIKDILAYLKLAYNNKDVTAFERIINVPKRGLGDVTKEKILLSNHSLNDIINNKADLKSLGITPRARKRFTEFLNILNNLKDMIAKEISINEMIYYIINTTEYENYLEKECNVDGTFTQKKTNLRTLQELSRTWNSDIEDFLNNAYLGEDSIVVNSDGNETNEDKNCVNIMTIHSSKGLEFENVFICDCTDNYIPFVLSHNDPSKIEEERRLFYVAMTRAKHNLFLMFPSYTIRRDGNRDTSSESRFVREIPKKYLEKMMVRTA